ncbi:hypothetical protein [Porticoccus sp.]
MRKAISLLVFLTCLSQLCYGVSEEERRATWDKLREIKSQTSLTLHPSQGEITRGANMVEPGEELAKNFSEIYLLRIVDPEDNEYFKLHVTALHQGDEWLNYTRAALKSGGQKKLTELSRQKLCEDNGSCQREEQLEVAISFEDIANNIGGRGLDIVLLGETRQEIHISSLYLLAMMQSM